ncbi:MAG TPA: hypothetical protein VGM63_06375 [Mucilaginibacter sp.]|jgi:hypothetical protein
MKHSLLYLFLLLLIITTGCLKSGSNNTVPPPIPSGTFTGQFKFYHRHTNTVPYDSLKANITVTFKTPAYTYAVTGDTATIHAGSYGTFGVSVPYMIFNDNTYNPKAYTKTHLSGEYLYNYDGTNLILQASSVDTLVLGYVLKKTSN